MSNIGEPKREIEIEPIWLPNEKPVEEPEKEEPVRREEPVTP